MSFLSLKGPNAISCLLYKRGLWWGQDVDSLHRRGRILACPPSSKEAGGTVWEDCGEQCIASSSSWCTIYPQSWEGPILDGPSQVQTSNEWRPGLLVLLLPLPSLILAMLDNPPLGLGQVRGWDVMTGKAISTSIFPCSSLRTLGRFRRY